MVAVAARLVAEVAADFASAWVVALAADARLAAETAVDFADVWRVGLLAVSAPTVAVTLLTTTSIPAHPQARSPIRTTRLKALATSCKTIRPRSDLIDSRS